MPGGVSAGSNGRAAIAPAALLRIPEPVFAKAVARSGEIQSLQGEELEEFLHPIFEESGTATPELAARVTDRRCGATFRITFDDAVKPPHAPQSHRDATEARHVCRMRRTPRARPTPR